MSDFNKTKYNENFSQIDWTKKYPKTFKTSWGVEYTIWLPEKTSDNKQVESDTTFTIDELTSKNRTEE
tara:strand:+ start:59739 stop:59942 length:204 start_codon:yes stop_codon:yes gene_type:complete